MLCDVCLTSFISFVPRVLHILGKCSTVELYASLSFLLGQSFTMSSWLWAVAHPDLLFLVYYSTKKIEGFEKEAPWAPGSIVSINLPLSTHGLLYFLVLWIHFTVFHLKILNPSIYIPQLIIKDINSLYSFFRISIFSLHKS